MRMSGGKLNVDFIMQNSEGDRVKSRIDGNLWFWEFQSGSVVTKKTWHRYITQVQQEQTLQVVVENFLGEMPTKVYFSTKI